MSIGRIFSSWCLAISVAGCSSLPVKYRLAAEPLMGVPEKSPNGAYISERYAGLNNVEVVHLIVQDSQKKCAEFVDSMFAENAGTNTALDSLGTLSSALATVFTPIAVTHSLSAASTLFSGVKSSISADYLNTMAIGHVAQAIQVTYSSDMQKYIGYLNTADPAKIDVIAERSRIESYHNECSLAAAEGSIDSTLTPITLPPSPQLGVAPPPAPPPVLQSSPPPAAVSGAAMH
jgi:hypothetical protein